MNIFGQEVFAQETTTSTAVPDSGPEGAGGLKRDGWGSAMETMLIMFLLLIVMWFILIRPQQREQKRRQAMWDSLRKMDKIVTIGGVHGVITDINREKDTLTVRIDEDKNVKITIWINCVSQVLSDE